MPLGSKLAMPQGHYNGKNDVFTFSRLFLIGSFSYLQVMITYIRALMSLKFGQIQPLVSMVTDRVMIGKDGVSTFSRLFFLLILFILACNDDMHESSDKFEFRPDCTTD